MTNLLISGGAGFIGTQLVDAVASPRQVVVLDNLHPQVHTTGAWPAALRDGDARLHLADVASVAAWETALSDVEDPFTVVHLAAETGTGQSLTQASRHASVNVGGTAALTDALSRSGRRPRSIILTSSRAVYGEGSWRDANGETFQAPQRRVADLDARRWAPMNGSVPGIEPLPNEASGPKPQPTNIYAVTKLTQEQLLGVWCDVAGVPLSVLRLQNVYGAGQALENGETGVLTAFARRSVNGERLEVYEDGGILRDFVHVRDVVDALLSAISSPPDGGRIIDIGSGRPRTLWDVAVMMAEIAGAPTPVASPRYRPGDVRAAYASMRAAASELRFSSRVRFEDGMRELLEYASSDGH